MLPAFLLIMLAAFAGSGVLVLAAVVVGFLYLLALAIIQSALQGVFQAALYEFARSGQVPEAFDRDLLAGAVAVKNK